MGTDRTSEKSYLTGFIVPRSGWSYWAAESNVDFQSPYPGKAVADRTSTMRLLPSGTPENSDTLDILAADGGIPGRYLWRPSGGTYRGWEPPVVYNQQEALTFTGTDVDYSLCTTKGGKVVCACEIDGGSGARSILVRVRATDGTWGSEVTVVSTSVPSAASSRYLRPCLITEPSGIIALYCLDYVGGAQTIACVQKYISLDDGATWELSELSGNISRSVAAFEVTQLQIASTGDQWVMFHTINASPSAVYQYGSVDGVKWEYVGEVTTDGECYDVIARDGFFYALICYDTGTAANDTHVFRFGSAFTALSESSEGQTQLTAVGDGNFPVGALCVEDSGRIWALFGIGATSSGDLYSAHTDDGTNWVPTGSTPVEPARFYSHNQALDTCRATFALGMCFLMVNDGDSRIKIFGGSSTTANPRGGTEWGGNDGAGANVPDSVVKYPNGWDDFGSSITSGTGLSSSHTGAPTVSGGSWSGTSADTALFSLTSPIAADHFHQAALFQTDPSGSATGTRTDLTLELTTDTSTPVSYAATVRMEVGSNLELIDVASATSRASTTMPTTEFQIKVWLSEGKAALWYRLMSGDPSDREWTEVGSDLTLTDNASANNDITISTTTGTAASWDAEHKLLQWNIGQRPDAAGTNDLIAVDGQAEGIDATYRNLWARDFSTRPTYVHDGVSIRGRGSAKRLDSWTITPGATYHPSNVLTNVRPSPRHPWKSSTTTNRELALQRTSDGDAVIDHNVIAIYFENCNFYDCTISRYAGGSWTSIGTHTAYVTLGDAKVSADGVNIYPNTTGSSGSAPYFRRGQLAGCWVYDGTSFYEISGNTEGTWDAGGADEKRCTIFLTDTYGSSTITAPKIVFRRSVAIVNVDQRVEWEGIKITFGSTLPETHIQAGNIVCDDLLLFGAGPDQSRALVLELGEKVTETEDGHVYTDSTMPNRRRVELTWARSIPLVNNEDADPDYVMQDTTEGPVADYLDAPLVLQALVEEQGRNPFVYLPRVPIVGANGITSIVKDNAGGAFLARFVPDSLRLETVHGHAATGDEIVRVSGVTLREVV